MSAFATTVVALTDSLKSQFGLVPIIGFEVECYLRKEDAAFLPTDEDWKYFATLAQNASIMTDAMKEEDGEGQFEFCLSPTNSAHALEQIAALKKVLSDWVRGLGAEVVFTPRVEEEQPSSALHVHLHLEDASGRNIFTKEDEVLSETLAHAIAGLLELLPESMVCFAPESDSYKRYREWEKYTPSKVAWGNNNRTTPIRLPANEKPSAFRHIEHRVSAADVEPERALAAILAGVLLGLEEKPPLPECMFGDARERNYPALEDLPKTLELAVAKYIEGGRLQGYLQPEAKEAMKLLTDAQSASVA